MPSLPWGVIVLMILAVVLYLQGLKNALTAWRLSLDIALVIILLLITANFLTIPIRTGGETVSFHGGCLLLFFFVLLLWYFQGGKAKPAWLFTGVGLAAGAMILNVLSQNFWTTAWLDPYWLLPLLTASVAVILTRNMAGVVFITAFSLLLGQAASAFYYNLTAGTWLTIGNQNTFDMAILGAVLAGLLVALAQLMAVRRFAYHEKHFGS